MYREFANRNFVIIAVALDSGGPDAVRAFIRPTEPIVIPPAMQAIMGWSDAQIALAGVPSYPCLIDEGHVVAQRYGMKNVPTAVWIDEDGRIVRPAEPAGASDGFRFRDRSSPSVPAELIEAARASRARYIAALRDWIERGGDSGYALDPEKARDRVAPMTDDEARGATAFALGRYLHENGKPELAKRWFDEATRLCPEHWTYFRQALQLEETGKASGPEFVARLRALGDKRYYDEVRYD